MNACVPACVHACALMVAGLDLCVRGRCFLSCDSVCLGLYVSQIPAWVPSMDVCASRTVSHYCWGRECNKYVAYRGLH